MRWGLCEAYVKVNLYVRRMGGGGFDDRGQQTWVRGCLLGGRHVQRRHASGACVTRGVMRGCERGMKGVLERVMEWHATEPCAGVLCKPLWLWRLTLYSIHPRWSTRHRLYTLLVPGHGIIHRGRGKQATGVVQDEPLKTGGPHPGPLSRASVAVLGATRTSDRATAARQIRCSCKMHPLHPATHSNVQGGAKSPAMGRIQTSCR